MHRRTVFPLVTLALLLAGSALANADAGVPAEPALGTGHPATPALSEAPLAAPDLPLFDVMTTAKAQDFQGCPIEDVLFIDPGLRICDDGDQVCTDACAQAGATLIFWATSTGADCQCVCCSS